MNFKLEQRFVFIQMMLAVVTVIAIIGYGMLFNSFGYSDTLDPYERVHAFAPFLFCLILPLLISIGRLAGQRFFHVDDIDSQHVGHGSVQHRGLEHGGQSADAGGGAATRSSDMGEPTRDIRDDGPSDGARRSSAAAGNVGDPGIFPNLSASGRPAGPGGGGGGGGGGRSRT